MKENSGDIQANSLCSQCWFKEVCNMTDKKNSRGTEERKI